MSMNRTSGRSGGRLARGALWTVKALLALVCLYAAGRKLTGNSKMVAEFSEIGFGQSFRIVTGAIEAAGALLLLWPRIAFFGSLVLLGVCAGALAAQLAALHHDIVHVLVLGGLVIIVGWFERPAALRGLS